MISKNTSHLVYTWLCLKDQDNIVYIETLSEHMITFYVVKRVCVVPCFTLDLQGLTEYKYLYALLCASIFLGIKIVCFY
ncbi:hypothetical protein HS5_07130 [Acidianus sp. HS-5]|nr:hypothetical protein HS5_07130 [Acidianus sp. HS-5]